MPIQVYDVNADSQIELTDEAYKALKKRLVDLLGEKELLLQENANLKRGFAQIDSYFTALVKAMLFGKPYKPILKHIDLELEDIKHDIH